MGGFGDEDDIHIGDVIEFLGPTLAHGHDGQSGVDRLLSVHTGDRDSQGGGERGIRQVAQTTGDRGELDPRLGFATGVVGVGPGEVEGCQTHHEGAVGKPQRPFSLHPGQRGPVGARRGEILRGGVGDLLLIPLAVPLVVDGHHVGGGRPDRLEHRGEHLRPRRGFLTEQLP